MGVVNTALYFTSVAFCRVGSVGGVIDTYGAVEIKDITLSKIA